MHDHVFEFSNQGNLVVRIDIGYIISSQPAVQVTKLSFSVHQNKLECFSLAKFFNKVCSRTYWGETPFVNMDKL